LEIAKLDTVPKSASPAWPEKPAGHDYEALLLTHAKLYILSYSQGIRALSDLCIARLHRELKEISPPPIDQRILENVVELLRYAYCIPRDAATPQPLQPAWTELQNLVSQFCALNIDVMGGGQEFKALLQEGGVLATDMMAKTIRHLMSSETSLIKANNAIVAAEAALVKASNSAAAASNLPSSWPISGFGTNPALSPLFGQTSQRKQAPSLFSLPQQ
jgi:hypothetical protein